MVKATTSVRAKPRRTNETRKVLRKGLFEPKLGCIARNTRMKLGHDFGPRPLVCGYFLQTAASLRLRLGPRNASIFNGSRPDQGQMMIGNTCRVHVTLVTVPLYE